MLFSGFHAHLVHSSAADTTCILCAGILAMLLCITPCNDGVVRDGQSAEVLCNDGEKLTAEDGLVMSSSVGSAGLPAVLVSWMFFSRSEVFVRAGAMPQLSACKECIGTNVLLLFVACLHSIARRYMFCQQATRWSTA
jgi:hypothetical protein